MRPSAFVLVALTGLACSGGPDDPCAIDAVEGRPASAAAADLAIDRPLLECTGTSGGASLKCAGSATVAPVSCADGFGFIVDGGSTKVLLRFKGGEAWSWGAALAGGEALHGSVTISGLRDPADPVPSSGMSHAASFALNATSAVVNGKLVASW